VPKPSPADIIRQYAPKYGLDPAAVIAYMMEESSGRWDAVGDHGTSFGPFQMHRGGALGSHSAGWAMSPAGLIGGMKMMAATPIRGQQGTDALWAIYVNFGKGTDNHAAYQRALPFLDGGGSATPQSDYVNPVPSGARFERTDQGIDWQGKPGQEVVAIGDSKVVRISTDAGGFGTVLYMRIMDGPWKGRVWYVGHALPTVKVGQTVAAGDPVAMLLQHPGGNAGGIPGHTEVGWATSNGSGPAGGMNAGAQFQKDLQGMGILTPGAHATTVWSDAASSGGQTSAALTPEQQAALDARNASAQATPPDVTPPTLGGETADDTPQLWYQIATQDNIAPETSQLAAQYVSNQLTPVQSPFPTGPFQPSPSPTGIPA
jgi:hypothetical protein